MASSSSDQGPTPLSYFKWPLDELVKIMECSENGKTRPVLPIYFHVQRSDVQYEKNSYRTAMIDQEKGRYKHRVEAWRSALSAVGSIYGQNISRLTDWFSCSLFDAGNHGDGDEISKFVAELYNKISLTL
ncbi:disease resistance protein RLM3-like [Arachis hypogaea]|uniref:disease resistance protein RLM3-like n=1 Tax=Arachis hypogaea TaxID=3818 RepID=UPI0010FC452D|nr:disease resistance protein RLM3-like [Arachis hypogaea]